jgi:heat shock protein HslJ
MSRRALAGLVALVLILTACSAGPGAGGQLEGSDWVLQSYDVDGTLTIVPETVYVDAEFGNTRVSGFGGCNTYDAVYRAGGRTLFISQVASTKMACGDEADALEAAYFALLDQSRFYTARRNDLTIYGAEGRVLLVFAAAPRNPLLGNWIVDSFATAPNELVTPLEGTRLTTVFGIASVGGEAGCNSYTGTYGTNGDVVRIGPLATTRMACDQAIMDQETAFLAALQGVARIERRADGVRLTDRNGAISVALIRPTVDPGASAPPSGEPTATPSPSPTASPSPTPEATPSPSPTPTATAAPTEPPPTATPAPTLAPPPSLPPTASCDVQAEGAAVATVSYPASWSTVSEPADLACRYFDPEPIEVPADPATLTTAVTIVLGADPLDAAVAAATDPASWDVSRQVDATIGGQPATVVEATATADTAGIPIGTARLAYVIELPGGGTMTIQTTGTAGDAAFATNSTVASLMAATLEVAGA